jgi:hypothetical protein
MCGAFCIGGNNRIEMARCGFRCLPGLKHNKSERGFQDGRTVAARRTVELTIYLGSRPNNVADIAGHIVDGVVAHPGQFLLMFSPDMANAKASVWACMSADSQEDLASRDPLTFRHNLGDHAITSQPSGVCNVLVRGAEDPVIFARHSETKWTRKGHYITQILRFGGLALATVLSSWSAAKANRKSGYPDCDDMLPSPNWRCGLDRWGTKGHKRARGRIGLSAYTRY